MDQRDRDGCDGVKDGPYGFQGHEHRLRHPVDDTTLSDVGIYLSYLCRSTGGEAEQEGEKNVFQFLNLSSQRARELRSKCTRSWS